jgi:uncharacterized protein (DUF433 family)
MTFERITVNPKIYNGKPCIRGTRIAVTMILDLLEDGLAFDVILKDYYPQLTKDDLKACLEYARAVIEGEEIYFAERPLAT